jgi:hypothetical protein
VPLLTAGRRVTCPQTSQLPLFVGLGYIMENYIGVNMIRSIEKGKSYITISRDFNIFPKKSLTGGYLEVAATFRLRY